MAGILDRVKSAMQTLAGDQQPPVQAKQYGTVKKLSADKKTEMVGDLDQKIKAGIAAYADRKQKMLVADKYWLAEHWDDNSPPWMPKPVENWVFATVEQHSANLATANIVPIIYGQDPGDDEIANMFDLVVQYLWTPNKLNGRQIIRESIHTALMMGTAIVKVYWDNNVNGGRWLSPDRTPKEFTNPITQEPFPVTHTFYKGEVCMEMVDPSNVIPDPSGYALKGPGACSWITVRTPRSANWIGANQLFQQYVGKAQLKTLLDQMEAGDKGSTEFYHGRTVNNTYTGSKEYMLDEVWMRQMDEFGNWHINLAYKVGEELLYYAEDVYRDGEFPFAVLYDYKISKSFFGMGEPEQVIANQNTINQISRLVALNAMHMTNTQKVVTTDSGIDPDKVSELGSMPGAVWKSRTPDGIKNLDVKEIPGTVFKTVSEAREGIRMIMAMDEANMGQFGGSVTAASGIKMIQDKANVRDQDKGFNVEDFVSRLVFLVISRIQQFYTEDRYIPITGQQTGPRQFFPFKGSDYADLTLLVHVEAGSGTPLNKAAISQRAWDMFQKQAEKNFDPPLITAEELLDTYEGFPLKERIKKRIKEANSGKQIQDAMQLASVMMMLQQQGIDPMSIPPEQLIATAQQMQMSQGQNMGATQGPPMEGNPPPMEGNPQPPQG